MKQETYDESIQHRATHHQPVSKAEGGVLVKKKECLPAVKVAEFVFFDPNIRTYSVRIDRRLFKKQKTGFDTLGDALKWRDTQLAEAPKPEVRTGVMKDEAAEDEKLIEELAKSSREADAMLRKVEKLQMEIVSRINRGRGKKELKIRELAAKAKMKMSRVVNITYNTALLKTSEARTLLAVVRG